MYRIQNLTGMHILAEQAFEHTVQFMFKDIYSCKIVHRIDSIDCNHYLPPHWEGGRFWLRCLLCRSARAPGQAYLFYAQYVHDVPKQLHISLLQLHNTGGVHM